MIARDELKKEIISYLTSVGVSKKDLVAKSLSAIKSAAYFGDSLDAEMMEQKHIRDYARACGLKIGDEFYFPLSRNFAPRHYQKLVSFVKILEQIEDVESQAEYELEEKIDTEINGQIDPLSDGSYDELGAPDFAVCIYEKYIEVRAFEKGVGEILPKQGRKYIGSQGDMRWSFPLSSLNALKRMNRPVVNISELTGTRVKPPSFNRGSGS